MYQRFFNPLWNITERYSPEGHRMRAEVKVIDNFVYSLMDSRESSEEDGAREDLLTLYMKLRLEDGSKLSRVGVR